MAQVPKAAPGRRATALTLGLSLATGCASWGSPAHVPEGSDAPVRWPAELTFVGARGDPLPPDAVVDVTEGPPPQTASLIAIVRVRCNDRDNEGCLRRLTAEVRALGGNAIYGLREDFNVRPETYHLFVGSAGRAPSEHVEPKPPAEGARTVTLTWDRAADQARFGLSRLVLERKVGIQSTSWPLDNWQPVCELPCEAALDPAVQYAVHAPQLPDQPPVPITASQAAHLRAAGTVGRAHYTGLWVGITFVVLGGGLGGAVVWDDVATHGKPSADLLSGGILALVFFATGAYAIFAGPDRDVGVTVTPVPR